MATRYYVSNAAPGYTPSAIQGSWGLFASTQTGKLGAKAGAAAVATPAGQAVGGTWSELTGRWISDPITAYTFSGTDTVQWVLGEKISNVTNTATSRLVVHIYVTQGDSNLVRGTLLSNGIGGINLTATATGRADSSIALGSVSAQTGDRIVVEIGWQKNGTATALRQNSLNYGGTGGTDLANASTTIANPGWIEFSPTLTTFIDTPPTITQNTADGTSTSNTTPTLEFTGSDADSDDLEYEVQIDTVNTFNSITGGYLTPSVVQGTSGGASYNNSMSTSAFGSTVASGNAIVAGIISPFNGAADVTSVTDTGGNTYTKVDTVLLASDFVLVEVWVALNITGGSSFIVTAHDSGSNLVGTYAYELNGVALTSAVDVIGKATRDYVSTTVNPSITTTLAAEVLVAFTSADNATGSWTGDAGWSNTRTLGSIINSIAQTKVVSTTGTYGPTETYSAANGLASIVVGIKAYGSPDAPIIDKLSTTDAGFANTVTGGDTHSFNQAEKASYTVQSALTPGTYYWRVRATDPYGGVSSWSATRSIIITSGSAYTKSLTASVSPAGSFVKQTARGLTAGLTSAGNFSKKTLRSLTAGLTSSGSVKKKAIRGLTATLTSSGVLATARLKAMAFTASLSPTGTIGRAINRPFTASVTPAGAFAKRTVRNITASLSPSGAFTKKFIHSFTASLSPTGAFTKLAKKALTAGMTSSGSFKKGIRRGLTASLTPAGAFSRSLIKFVTFTANMTFVGSVGTLRRMIFTAGLTMSGTIANRWIPVVGSVVQTIAATITSGIRTALGGANTNSTSVNSGNVVATDNGADTIREISTNTNNQTLDNPSNKTEVD